MVRAASPKVAAILARSQFNILCWDMIGYGC
jgi:hypothetical protein